MPKQQAVLESAREKHQRILLVNQVKEETLEVKRKRAQKLAEWGQLYEDAPLAQKQMIPAEILDRSEVGRGYRTRVKFKLTSQQFLEPNADGNEDHKAS